MNKNIDFKGVLNRLPNLKLSYEYHDHKKVPHDMYYIIPKGKKFIAWFTYIRDEKVCIFLEMNKTKYITTKFVKKVFFEKKLVLGTIFYGTLLHENNNTFFNIENIHYFKGKNVEMKTHYQKLELIQHIFEKEITQNKNSEIIFTLPIICKSFNDAIQECKKSVYPIYSIQSRNFNNNDIKINASLYQISNLNVVFGIKALIKNDIYELYTENNGILEKYDVAFISDYKTSVMMNQIFRNIKENDNLDALEESDDEDEFENINEDKFVDLNKCVYMECNLNKKYNKWMPVKISKEKKAITKHQIKILEKKK
jgi:hypothetical protein